MRIGLIGAGYMAGIHARAWAAMDDVEVVAVAGSKQGSGAQLALALGVPERSKEEILNDPTVAAVDITVPTALHEEIVSMSLRARKHVFCETPLAQTTAEAERMIAVAREEKRHLQVALLHRFTQQTAFVRGAIVRGEIGEVQAVTMSRRAPGTGGAHHGDALEELMLFDLEFLVWMFGEPSEARATALRDANGRIQHAYATLEFGKMRAMTEASFLLPKSHPFATSIFVIGSEGAVSAEFESGSKGPLGSMCTLYPRSGTPVSTDDLGSDPYRAECRYFADVINSAAEPDFLDVAHAVKALRLLDALRASLIN